MVGVLAEANVGDHQQIQVGFANSLDRTLHHALRTQRACGARVFCFWKPKEDHRRNPKRLDFPALFDNLIRRLLVNPRHRADFLAHILPGTHKHRVDQASRTQARFADHAAKRFGAAQTPGPMRGKAHACFAPAGAAFAAAKCFSKASTTATAVVSAATTTRSTPASRKAFAVTGPTAAIATSFCRLINERQLVTDTTAKCFTADGLKNKIACTSPNAVSPN